jgi:hypothetical protein
MLPIDLIAYEISVWLLPIIIAVTFHESVHGFVARLFGDDTAWRLGRVSFNPAKHIDPFGTIIVPVILLLFRAPFIFGYAKPVPVNFRAVRRQRVGMISVVASGPLMNFLLATVAALAFHLIAHVPALMTRWLVENLENVILRNVRVRVDLAMTALGAKSARHGQCPDCRESPRPLVTDLLRPRAAVEAKILMLRQRPTPQMDRPGGFARAKTAT